MRAVNLRFYNKRLSESRASEQNQEQPVGAGWTAYQRLRYSSIQNSLFKIILATFLKFVFKSMIINPFF